MIRPLRDMIVVVMLDDTTKTGTLHLPENYKQALIQHGRALVLYAGPKAREEGCPPGMVVHVSETWGEPMEHNGRKLKIGSLKFINGMLPGEQVEDRMKYMD